MHIIYNGSKFVTFNCNTYVYIFMNFDPVVLTTSIILQPINDSFTTIRWITNRTGHILLVPHMNPSTLGEWCTLYENRCNMYVMNTVDHILHFRYCKQRTKLSTKLKG